MVFPVAAGLSTVFLECFEAPENKSGKHGLDG